MLDSVVADWDDEPVCAEVVPLCEEVAWLVASLELASEAVVVGPELAALLAVATQETISTSTL